MGKMAFISSHTIISFAAFLLLAHSSYHYGFDSICQAWRKSIETRGRSLVSYTHYGNTTTIWYNDTYSVTYDSSQYSVAEYDDDDQYSNETFYYDYQQDDDQEEDQAEDEEYNDAEENYEADDDLIDENSLIGNIIEITLQAEESLNTIFQKSPRRWTGAEWALLSSLVGILVTVIGILTCCCYCSARRCTNVCEKSDDDFTTTSNASLFSGEDETQRSALRSDKIVKNEDNGMSYVRMAPSGMGNMSKV